MAVSGVVIPGLRRACCGRVLRDRRLEEADVPLKADGRDADVDGDGEAALEVLRGEEEVTEPALKGGFFR